MPRQPYPQQPMPPAPGYVGLGDPQRTARRHFRRNRLVLAVSIAVAAIAAIALTLTLTIRAIDSVKSVDLDTAVAGRGELKPFELARGDCLRSLNTSPYQGVPCDDGHVGQVVLVAELPDDAAFDNMKIRRESARLCQAEVPKAAPKAAEQSEPVSLFYLYPSASTWQQGDRAVTCIVATDGEPLTSSLI
ncbi:septum formation family protein [Saxibacter everestensis]|uniref:Septum formation family protein n=1 Tax=Saxibacter everestensis TaxID=2909229 RepID=A0ABY8QT83_9MICO|nr:septum formation family protein [Brevibacteriaceae bacterium ZFBP1038]